MATTRERAPKTPEEVVSGLRRQVKSAEKRAVEEDPWMMTDMFDLAAEMEQAAVRVMAALRAKGYTWNDIAVSMNAASAERITGQTLIKRYAKRVAEINTWKTAGHIAGGSVVVTVRSEGGQS
jgi:hypothetical protein